MLVHNGKERAAGSARDVSIAPTGVLERRGYLRSLVAANDRRRNRNRDIDVAERIGRVIASNWTERRDENY